MNLCSFDQHLREGKSLGLPESFRLPITEFHCFIRCLVPSYYIQYTHNVRVNIYSLEYRPPYNGVFLRLLLRYSSPRLRNLLNSLAGPGMQYKRRQ